MKKLTKQIVFLFLLPYICVLEGCNEKKSHEFLDLFTESQPLATQEEYNINEDSIALIEGIICNGENLVIYDFHSGSCYTLFDKYSGKYIARFGAIGQGPTEIPSPCFGYLSKNCFSVFDDQIRIVMRYNLDSLRSNRANPSTACLTKYNIPEAQFSQLIAINDSTFIGAGSYKSQYQYALFNKNNQVLDYNIDIYNASDKTFNIYTKFLSNQGTLVRHPEKNMFAYSLNFSSNIDFFKIENNKIELTKSLRKGDPIYHPAEQNGMFSADLTENTLIGYIHLSATSKYLYALYSDKKTYESRRKSNIVLVFDWQGNPIKKYILDEEAYYIAVDEEHGRMFAAVKNADSGWSIISYVL